MNVCVCVHSTVLISDPLFQGEFLLLPNATDPPFQPPPLPDPSEEDFPNTKMVHIVVSNYVAETAAYAFKEAGQLAYNITSDKVKMKKKLTYSCSSVSKESESFYFLQLWIFKKTDTWCASTLVPQVKRGLRAMCESHGELSGTKLAKHHYHPYHPLCVVCVCVCVSFPICRRCVTNSQRWTCCWG